MKKMLLAIGVVVFVSQGAQAQYWRNDPYPLEQAHRDADNDFRAWETEQRLHEQRRSMEDLEARQRLQQYQIDDAANRLRYERPW
jgi:hypothetical protein